MGMKILAKLSEPIPGLSTRPVAGRWVEVDDQKIRSLQGDPRIQATAPNSTFQTDEVRPNDLRPEQWSLPHIGAPQAWKQSVGAGGPIVAVLDTGLDVNHPDLAPNLWKNLGEIPGNAIDDEGNGVVDDVHGYNAVSHTGDLKDSAEHGTHVAGIIAARGDNGQGMTGLNWQGRLMGIKIFDDHGNSDVATICRAIDYARQQGAQILNCSWGGAIEFNAALYDTLKEFPGLVVCSAGNSGSDNDRVPHYPSSFDLPQIVAVAASSRADRLCFTSNYGATSVDLAAPGEQILSTVPGGGYKVKSGTSQAAPHVSGAAALLSATDPTAGPLELKARLLESSERVAHLEGKVRSHGRLGVGKAFEQEPKASHGPHLLHEFHRDIVEGRQEALLADNQFPDTDPRHNRIDFGHQQTMVTPQGMALRESGPDGEPGMMVWLEAHQKGETLVVDQRGYQRDALGFYAFPLHLEGGPNKPFDPPDAERISAQEFQKAVEEFDLQWNQGPAQQRMG